MPDVNGPPRTPRNRLTINEVSEISLVGAGDNEPAKIVIAKARPDRNPSGNETDITLGAMPEHEPDVGDNKELLGLIVEQNARLAKMLAVAVGVDPDEDEEGFAKAFSAIAKARHEDDYDEDDEDLEYEDEDDEEYVAKSEDEEDEDDDDEDEEDDEDDSVLKSDPRFAALVAGYEAQIAKANHTAEAAARMALAERERTLDERFTKSATALDNVAGEDDLAVLLKDLYLANPELCERVEKTLARASTLVEESAAFEVSGYTPSTVRKGATLDDIESLMDQALTKSNGSMTPEQAFVAALEKAPGVYDNWAMDQTLQRMGGRA